MEACIIEHCSWLASFFLISLLISYFEDSDEVPDLQRLVGVMSPSKTVVRESMEKSLSENLRRAR